MNRPALMTAGQLSNILAQIKLAPWYRNVEWVVQDIEMFSDAEWIGIGRLPVARFRIEYDEPDVETGEMSRQIARWWYVDADMTVEAVIKSAWLALVVSDEHRRREGFEVGGVRLFDPHAPIIWPGAGVADARD